MASGKGLVLYEMNCLKTKPREKGVPFMKKKSKVKTGYLVVMHNGEKSEGGGEVDIHRNSSISKKKGEKRVYSSKV